MTRPRKNKADWQPDGITLEPNALKAVNGERNALVVAGPGAGRRNYWPSVQVFSWKLNSVPLRIEYWQSALSARQPKI